MDRELMQQALEALESDPISHAGLVNRKQAITALRERLAQPEQDYRTRYDRGCYKCGSHYCPADCPMPTHLAPQQPEQEPVAWGVFDGPNLHDVNFTKEEAHEMARLKGDGSVVKPLYTSTQPQMQPCAGRNCGSTNPNLHSAECFEDYEKSTGMNQWQGLTYEEIEHIADSEWEEAFVRMIEAKLKDKNQ